jgi:hypothetical protein
MAMVGEELSPRSRARYWRSHKILLDAAEAGIIEWDRVLRAVKIAARPNGSFNIAELERQADIVFMRWVDVVRAAKAKAA